MTDSEEIQLRLFLQRKGNAVNGDQARWMVRLALKEIDRLRVLAAGLVERAAGQSELLSQRAEVERNPA